MMSGAPSRVAKYTEPLYLPLAVILIWWAGSYFNIFNSYLVPAPSLTFSYLKESVADNTLIYHCLVSLRRVAIGFAIAAVIALPLGIVYGSFAKARRIGFAFLEFMRHIPPLALIPLLILFFGIDETSKIALIVLASFFPIFMSAAGGIANVDKKLLEVGGIFHFSKIQTFRRISVPAAFPSIITGLQLGMGYSFRALVGAELIAASSGLGYLIQDAQLFARMDIIFAGIFTLGVLGMITDYIFIILLKKVMPYGDRASI